MSLRIGIISEHASPLACLGGIDSGGQNVYVAQIARHLGGMGHQVDVLTRRDSPDLPDCVDWDANVRIVHIPAGPARRIRKEEMLPYMEMFTERVAGQMKREGQKYDLLHANFFMSGLVAADLKRRAGIPFVVTFHALGRVRRQHQGDADGFPDARMEIEERIVSEADAIIAECPQDREDLIRLYGAYFGKLALIPCGVDSSEFFPIGRRKARRILGLDIDRPLILQLGRMVRRKGVDNVIRGLAKLRYRHGLEAALVVVGGDSPDPDPALTPEFGRLSNIAEEEGVSDAVTFTGARPREMLRYYYSAADVFVTTPWYEPFGITPLEAMACGTPVIGSAVGGIPYSVRDGETGFLVPPNDPESLAERLNYLLHRPMLIQRFGRNSIDRTAAFFGWNLIAKKINRVYYRVLRRIAVSATADSLPSPVRSSAGWKSGRSQRRGIAAEARAISGKG